MFKKMLEYIIDFDTIYLFRHVQSDYDALGSQFGLCEIIKSNFPNKKIYCLGEENLDLMHRMSICYNKEKIYEENSLAIVLDTANHERIDDDFYKKCKIVVKVDHHMIVDSYGHLNIENPNVSSTSELITQFALCNESLILTPKAATYLYFGIVGDTNRFMFDLASANTFIAAAKLLEAGVNKQEVYEAMYLCNKNELDVRAFILNHYKYTKGLAYYVLRQEDLESLSLTRQRGSDFVNVLSNVSEFEVWMAITENVEASNWRVSLRSRNIPVEPIARKYHGGGHKLASGATLEHFDQLDDLIKDITDAIEHKREEL